MQEILNVRLRLGLTFYGTFGFLAGFIAARTFANLNPTVVIFDPHSGIHFHHFWYGLAMVVSTGWLGIALSDHRLQRSMALVFGLGAGLIGDEIGLLLTFGNYQSELTLWFFVGAIGLIVNVSLLLRFRTQIEKDLFKVEAKERLIHAGILVAPITAIFLAYGNWIVGGLVRGLGTAIILLAFQISRKHDSLRIFTD